MTDEQRRESHPPNGKTQNAVAAMAGSGLTELSTCQVRPELRPGHLQPRIHRVPSRRHHLAEAPTQCRRLRRRRWQRRWDSKTTLSRQTQQLPRLGCCRLGDCRLGPDRCPCLACYRLARYVLACGALARRSFPHHYPEACSKSLPNVAMVRV